ncbi:glucocorticoid modulatory element-binding protein 1 isoform X1 [Perca flavescens]|uniref:glucocorticoid modulatory element-binding protein 1 isoform X1 n=1 Tax=Perca flavescens TaxID=8167 RepID=UPI00106F0952|nr:translation initiation factor IF-2-like isoform X1 [Perca flavescens]XP_028453460.1 translation initiation factor IF-2-like isoform X1 [Perca flavescens]XP_028453461.1 translation initiation factor IF-2-like isoform X1 [Perca flavescens]
MATTDEVTVSMAEVVMVKGDNEGDPDDPNKTQVILQLQPIPTGDESAETDAAVMTVEAHPEQTDGEDVEIGCPITCGESKAVLLVKKFVCPGINVKCVKYEDQLISPKQFVHMSGKATLKDWKRAIRMGGVMLRKMMDSGQLDFYQHSTLCTNTCRSTKFDLLINNTRFPPDGSGLTTPTSSQAQVVLGNGGTAGEDRAEVLSAKMDWISSSLEAADRKESNEISEDTLNFWKGIADVGLLGEVVTNISTELLELLNGVQQRREPAGLQDTGGGAQQPCPSVRPAGLGQEDAGEDEAADGSQPGAHPQHAHQPGGAAGGTEEAAAGASSALLPAARQKQDSHQAPDQATASPEARLHHHPRDLVPQPAGRPAAPAVHRALPHLAVLGGPAVYHGGPAHRLPGPVLQHGHPAPRRLAALHPLHGDRRRRKRGHHHLAPVLGPHTGGHHHAGLQPAGHHGEPHRAAAPEPAGRRRRRRDGAHRRSGDGRNHAGAARSDAERGGGRPGAHGHRDQPGSHGAGGGGDGAAAERGVGQRRGRHDGPERDGGDDGCSRGGGDAVPNAGGTDWGRSGAAAGRKRTVVRGTDSGDRRKHSGRKHGQMKRTPYFIQQSRYGLVRSHHRLVKL